MTVPLAKMTPMPDTPNAISNARDALIDAVNHIDALLPGSIIQRHMRCGKRSCACKADPPQLHGPYMQWTRTVDGKTVTRYIAADQADRYQRWLDDTRHLKRLIAELETATAAAIDDVQRHTNAT